MMCKCLCHGNSIYQPCNPCCFGKKEETITIKKSLWDEMLEYKKKVDELKLEMLEKNAFMDYFNKRIEKLEDRLNEIYPVLR